MALTIDGLICLVLTASASVVKSAGGAPFNITVNMIAPGWIPVERHANDPEHEKEGYRRLIPMGRWGVPKDLAGTVVYLASEASDFVTGQDIHVNGGMTVG